MDKNRSIKKKLRVNMKKVQEKSKKLRLYIQNYKQDVKLGKQVSLSFKLQDIERLSLSK